MKKLIPVFLLSVLLLTGCGAKKFSRENSDGTVTVIRYTSAVPFQRAPVFEVNGTSLYMEFNGITWYRASILSREEFERCPKDELVAESSNLTVYRAANDVFQFHYFLDLEGTDEAFILFKSEADPLEPSIGKDFTTSVSYFTDETETVPDVEGLAAPRNG